MFIKRTGFPEESDLVMCTVTNIQHNSVFVQIHEYDRQGMITISEVAPGRIRNIRDYVSEGKVVVCKILNVNKERGYIDLSLRRVSESQRREKTDSLKQEIKAEKIIEMTAHALKIDGKGLYDKIATKFLPDYFYVYHAFEDVIAGTIDLKEIFDKNVAEVLEKNIRDKIRPKEIIIAGDINISIWETNGLSLIKEIFAHVQKQCSDMKISYLGGGNYRMILRGTDFKLIEKHLKEASDYLLERVKKHKGVAEYERVKNISAENAA